MYKRQVETLIEEDEPDKIEVLEQAGWFGQKEVEDFIRTARERQKLQALVYLMKLKDTRYQGWFIGAGVSYGYAFILGRHWNLETEIGLGYSYTRYDRYRCSGCGKKVETDKPHHYMGPTKAAINLVYLF